MKDFNPSVEKIHSKRYAGKGRRSFIKSLSGLGFGITTALHLTPEDVRAANNNEVPVVIGFETSSDNPGEKIPVTKNVPADWYNDYRHADSVYKRKREEISNVSSVESIWLVPGKYGGRNARIKVTVAKGTASQAYGQIPESIDGVPIEITEVGGYELGTCSTGNYNYGHYPDDVPGSVQICNGNVYGTLTGRIYDGNDLNDYFVISNHIYGGRGTEYQDEPLYQPESYYDTLGRVEYGHCGYDAMKIRPVNGHNPITRIEDATPSEDLTGWYSKEGLGDLSADGQSVKKYGCRTGYSQGKIESGDGWSQAYGCTKYGQLQWGDNDDFDDGDSGSLVYHEPPNDSGGYDESSIWACGMANAHTADWAELAGNFVWGTSAWKLHNQLDWYF